MFFTLDDGCRFFRSQIGSAERRTFTFEQQSAQLDFIVQEYEFLMWYDTIIIIKVDQKLSDLFQGLILKPSKVKVKKGLWPSPLLKLKTCFFRQVDIGPSQPVAAKVTVLYAAVHLNLRSEDFSSWSPVSCVLVTFCKRISATELEVK